MLSIFRGRPDPAELRPRVAGWKGQAWIWFPVVLGLAIIATESTNTFSSEHTSGWLRPVAERIFGHINDDWWNWIHHLMRKTGHFSGYGLLCLTFLRAWLLSLSLRVGWSTGVWRWRSSGLAVLCTAFVASTDEWHQTLIPSRTGTPHDVLLDTFGATMMCGVVWLFCWRRGVPLEGT